MRYDFGKIEKKWQDRWDEAGIFKATDDYSKPKFYGLVAVSYTHLLLPKPRSESRTTRASTTAIQNPLWSTKAA